MRRLLAKALWWLTGRGTKPGPAAQDVRFRWMYDRFRETLSINDSML
ncbi:MAG: hypothetical protein AB1726_14780 [Planctomycetota bacterium]